MKYVEEVENPLSINICVRTLLINGFFLIKAKRTESYIVLHTEKMDNFGLSIKYSFVLFYNTITTSTIKTIEKIVVKEKSNMVIIGCHKINGYNSYSWDEFYSKLGGALINMLPLNPDLADILDKLGHNQLPENYHGKADTLFEVSIKEVLKFVFPNPVIKYGQDRLFAPIPDGVIFVDQEQVALYDCKAYKDGYDITLDDIRRFADYIKEFEGKYSRFGLKVYCFLIISGHINNDSDSLDKRRRELYKKASTQLAVISATEIANTVRIILNNFVYRNVINWADILSYTVIKSQYVIDSIQELKKDKILEEK